MKQPSHSPFNSLMQSDSLEVHLLGVVDYDAALYLQERLVYEISGRNDRMGGLLLCEHPPIVTVGREGSRADLQISHEELSARGIELRWMNRGGRTIVHVPGQLAVYPILPLERLNCSPAEYRQKLEKAVINSCEELKVRAWQQPDHPGVFCQTGQIAQIGAAIKSSVSFHGLFLNVCPDMELVRWAQFPTISSSSDKTQNPEQIDRLSSLTAQRVRPTSMHKARESLVRQIAEQFEYPNHHIYTGHPLLTRTKKRVYVDA